MRPRVDPGRRGRGGTSTFQRWGLPLICTRDDLFLSGTPREDEEAKKKEISKDAGTYIVETSHQVVSWYSATRSGEQASVLRDCRRKPLWESEAVTLPSHKSRTQSRDLCISTSLCTISTPYGQVCLAMRGTAACPATQPDSDIGDFSQHVHMERTCVMLYPVSRICEWNGWPRLVFDGRWVKLVSGLDSWEARRPVTGSLAAWSSTCQRENAELSSETIDEWPTSAALCGCRSCCIERALFQKFFGASFEPVRSLVDSTTTSAPRRLVATVVRHTTAGRFWN